MKYFVSIFLLFTGLFISCSKSFETKEREKILLISIDGFRADYKELYNTPNLEDYAEQGVTSDYMIPVFPTKTFPNHYSIATGMYVENSGIVSNNMYDPSFDEYYGLRYRDAVQDSKWYQGEPIWVTAEKQGLKTAPMFWPGSEAPIGGINPSRSIKYDDDLPHKARVDSVINWLQLHDEAAPYFMTLYFSKVDTYGHWYGPESDSVSVAVEEIDFYLGYLKEELKRISLWKSLNIIIVSDHGMTPISKEQVILLDEIIDLNKVEIVDLAPVTVLKTGEMEVNNVYKHLIENAQNYEVFNKSDIPESFGYKNHRRVHDIIIVADLGYTITTSDRLVSMNLNGGNHGYLHTEKDMRSFFLARGNSFKKNYHTEAFKNIHLYELMSYILDIEPAQNDGSIDSTKHILTH